MDINTLTQMFIEAREADGHAERTLQDYQRVLNPFVTWCEKRQLHLDNLDRTAIRAYVRLLRRNKWKTGTLSIYIRVLRSFLRWLQLEELTLLQRDQLHPDPDDQTMWMQVYSPKTKSHHFAVLGIETTKSLQSYLQARKDAWPELWVGLRGPLTPLGIYRALRRRATKVDLDTRRVHPHAFRKLFATLWMDNGGDLLSLKRLGGWKTTGVVEGYVQLTGRRQLSKLHRRYSPSDRLLRT